MYDRLKSFDKINTQVKSVSVQSTQLGGKFRIMMCVTVFIMVLILGQTLSDQYHSLDGFSYDVGRSKEDFPDFRYAELFIQFKEQAEGFLISQQRMEAAQQQLNRIVERHERKITRILEGMEESFGSNVSVISDQSRRILDLQTICSNHDTIRNSLLNMPSCDRRYRSPSGGSVADVNSKVLCSPKTTGPCFMDIGPEREAKVYLEQQRFGGDWLVLLQRFDGSENFQRRWTDYRNGFGKVGQEFWLGLERVHFLTNSASYELLVELEDFEGNYRYARYSEFVLGSEEDSYPLQYLGTYSGTAGDSLTDHKGQKFSTMDKGEWKNCQVGHTGGWWYGVKSYCYEAHLTGRWDRSNSWTSIVWKKFGSPANLGLRFVRMMIRKK